VTLGMPLFSRAAIVYRRASEARRGSRGMASKDDFNMQQSTEMWDAFLRLAKWVIIVCVVTLAFMAMFLT
jgi:hypothetical protein